MGRAVIAMTAVRIRAWVRQGKVTDLSDIRPPTDVMAITSVLPAPRRFLQGGKALQGLQDFLWSVAVQIVAAAWESHMLAVGNEGLEGFRIPIG